MPLTYEKIASVTVGAGGASSIDFTNIDGSYTDLIVLTSARSDRNDGQDIFYIEFNGSGGTAYSSRLLYGSGSAVGSETFSSKAKIEYAGYLPALSATASTFGNASFYIPNYAGSTNKSASIEGVAENNATGAYMGITAGLWSNTAVITSIKITAIGSFVQYSTATLYGISKS